MDKDRQIRFLYPPLFFVGFWIWALYLDPARGVADYLPTGVQLPISLNNILGILAGGGVLVLVLGFLISSVSVALLRISFRLAGHHTYEAVLSDDCRERLSNAVGLQKSAPKSDVLYLAAVFDHGLLPDNIHTWLLRRWSAFNISAHSNLGLVLVLSSVLWSGLHPGLTWYTVWLGSLVFLLVHAVFAWSDTMQMIEFYSELGPSMFRDPT